MRDFFLEPQYFYHADKWAIDTETGFEESSWLAAEMTDESVKLEVLHASEDDSAEHIARMIGCRLQSFNASTWEMGKFEVDDLTADPAVLLLVISAFEDGELPAGAKIFLEQLDRKNDGELDRMAFGILVLGSSIYDDFGAAAEPLVRELERIGGRMMLPVRLADELQGQAATFDPWLGLVGRLMGEDATAASTEQEAPAKRLAVKEVVGSEVPRARPLRGEWARVANREVIREAGGREIHRLVIDVSSTTLNYRIGDRAVVYPRQSNQLVGRLCGRLGFSPSATVSAGYIGVFGEALDSEPPFPSPMPMSEVLAGELDLSWKEPFPELLRRMILGSRDPAETARLQDLLIAMERGRIDSRQVVRRQLVSLYPTVVDLLEAFPSVTLKLKTLVEVLPKIRPVYLTICSSPELEPGQVQVVFDLPSSDSKTDRSAIQSFLSNLSAGDPIRVDVRPSSFQLPEQPEAPLILIGQGSGLGVVAGFLSVIATRSQLGQPTPKIDVLIVGDAEPYGEQLRAWASQGTVSNLQIADSVEDVLKRQGVDLVNSLKKPGCHIYFSGETLAADSMHDTFIELLQQVGGRTYLEATDLIQELKNNGLVRRSIAIPALGRASLDEIRSAKYSLGKRWLRRYSALGSLESAAADG